jgi:hypothetical protein
LETGREFIDWFENDLLVLGIPLIADQFSCSENEAEMLLKKHVCLCYDICHFAIGYENHGIVLTELEQKGIRVGKIQISAALKANLIGTDEEKALKKDGSLIRYADLPPALEADNDEDVLQWRSHFHVPISIQQIGLLQSTQEDIVKVLQLQKAKPFTNHLEVETYTWEVLPEQIKLPIAQSISNELNWVINSLI